MPGVNRPLQGTSRDVIRRARLLAGCLGVAVLALLDGCRAYPTAAELSATALAVPPGQIEGPLLDGRARFREIFCQLARRDGASVPNDTDCRQLLWRLADEPAGSEGRSLPALDRSLRVVIVTGALSDCFGPDALPYREGVERMTASGLQVDTVTVSGRSSAEHNARQIAEYFEAGNFATTDRIVLLGYSKGAVDVLEFLDAYPDFARQVAAVISVAGPMFGSPLAEKGAWTYDHLLAHAFRSRCDPGDGGLIDSMLPATRKQWLADHSLPGQVAYFSLAAFTTREHLARSLRPSWRLLATTDMRNDGQVVAGDAFVPGSTLLGYANTDHWGLAITIERELPYLAARPAGNLLPQATLFEAMLRYVAESLDVAEGNR